MTFYFLSSCHFSSIFFVFPLSHSSCLLFQKSFMLKKMKKKLSVFSLIHLNWRSLFLCLLCKSVGLTESLCCDVLCWDISPKELQAPSSTWKQSLKAWLWKPSAGALNVIGDHLTSAGDSPICHPESFLLNVFRAAVCSKAVNKRSKYHPIKC